MVDSICIIVRNLIFINVRKFNILTGLFNYFPQNHEEPMLPDKLLYTKIVTAGIAVMVLFMVFSTGCSQEPSWKTLNDRIIKENNVPVRTREDIPETDVVSNLIPGEIINKNDLPDIELAPGVTCKMYWGKGTLVNWMTMDPGAEISRETLTGERIMFVWKGSVDQLVYGQFITMRQYNTVTDWTNTPHRDFIYLQKGTENAMKAGEDGAEILEVICPVRRDYVEKAGGTMPSTQSAGNFNTVPSIPPNQVLNFYDVQLITLSHWLR